MGLDEMEDYRELILENIGYDILLELYPYDKDLLDGYVELMLEVCCSTREFVRICALSCQFLNIKSFVSMDYSLLKLSFAIYLSHTPGNFDFINEA
ncbi:MAG: hypothetical protein K2N87_12245 [Eubacterium sp.]|nr:hypothetical protein [Eubacterium sp.]